MKRGIYCCIILLLAMNLFGCSSNNQNNKSNEQSAKQEDPNSFQIKAAKNLVKNYMIYLMNDNYEDAMKTYVKELKDKTKMTSSGNLKIKGFKIAEMDEIGKSGVFKVRVTRSDDEIPFSILDEYTIKVVKDITEYKISEVTCNTQKEAFVEYNQIRMKDKNNVKTNLVTDTSGIPEYAFAQDDATKTNRKKVPKKKFGRINFSYEGEKLGITTYEEDSFIGIINIDESLVVQGNAGGDAGSGDAGEGGVQKMITREKPIGKELISLDLLDESIVDFMSFSLDEKFVAVQYSSSEKGKCLRVYRTDNGDIIPVNFENEYPIEDVDVMFTSFDEDVLNFEIVKKENVEEQLDNILGKWKLDLKEFKLKKL